MKTVRLIALIDGRNVSFDDLVRANHKALKDFGYKSLTREEVAAQIEKILKNEELTVIGAFMVDDINVEESIKLQGS